MLLYKIMTNELWLQNQNKETLALAEIDNDFIHLSEKHQIDGVVKKFFSDESSCVLLTLDSEKLTGKLVHEKNPGGTQKFYHLYGGSIPKQAITKVEMIAASAK